MRISDWSSDVCSSDLAPGERQVRAPLPRDRAAGAGGRRAPAGPAAGRAGGVLGACQAWGSRMKTLLLFIVTARAEIIGFYMPYLMLRQDGSAALQMPAVVALATFVWMPALPHTASSSEYDSCGGFHDHRPLGVA